MKPPPEVVISGMAGQFPESANINQFKENLFNAVNMVTDDDRKWPRGFLGVPSAVGKIPDHTFDYTFFGLVEKIAEHLDPHARLSLQGAVAAVMDAGVNIQELPSNTGVLTATDQSEYEYCMMDKSVTGKLLGINRGIQANRISFFLNLSGISFASHSSGASAMEHFKQAQTLIQSGEIEACIVVISHLVFYPESSFHYNAIGCLSQDGSTKPFSEDANGQVRSEGVAAFFLQKKEVARRIYGTLIDVSHGGQGSKDGKFLDPPVRETYVKILRELYSANGIDIDSIGYIEAAGLGIKKVDAEELNGLAEAIANKKRRPLLVGSVKSNAGYADGASDGMAIVKALIAANDDLIPPNLGFSRPNTLVPALTEGTIKVVTEPTPLTEEVVGVSSISLSGGFQHALIRRHSEPPAAVKPQKGVLPPDGLPRLFIMSGRHQGKTEEVLKKVESMPIDPNFIGLTHKVFKEGVKNHNIRGFTILNNKQVVSKEVEEFFTGTKRRPVWWVFTGMGCQWPGMAADLMKLPSFAKAIHECHEYLLPMGLDLIKIITSKDKTMFDNILHSFVGIGAVQIALVDTLRLVGLEPDGIIGHSVGENGCAYADGSFTKEEMILSMYYRGKISLDLQNKIPVGHMAAVGKSFNEMKDKLPEGVQVACHNSNNSCTLTGLKDNIENFMEELRAKGIFVRKVDSSNIPFHSQYIKPVAVRLKPLLELVIKPKERSKKWISTSVPEDQWGQDQAKYSSAEYHCNNLLSPVLFEEACQHIPEDAILIEVAPHGLLQAILKRTFPKASNIPLTRRGDPEGLIFFLNALGKLYNRGVTLDIEKLYPEVQFPVPRGTPSLDFLITWDGSSFPGFADKHYEELKKLKEGKGDGTRSRDVSLNYTKEYPAFQEYLVRGTKLIPLSVYLDIFIKEFIKSLKLKKEKPLECLCISNITFKKYVEVVDDEICFSLTVGETGKFSASLGDEEILSCEMHVGDGLNPSDLYPTNGTQGAPGTLVLGTIFYQSLQLQDHVVGQELQLIKDLVHSDQGMRATVEWDGNLACFIEAILDLPTFDTKQTTLSKVTKINLITIDMGKFSNNKHEDVTVYFSKSMGVLYCDGMEIVNPLVMPVEPNLARECSFQKAEFMPYSIPEVNSLDEFLSHVRNIIVSNIIAGPKEIRKLTILEFIEDFNIHKNIIDIFKKQTDINIQVKLNRSGTRQKKKAMDSILVVGGSEEMTSIKDLIKNACHGFALIRGEVPTGLCVITKCQVGDHLYQLCSYEYTLNGTFAFISSSSKNWEIQLQSALDFKDNDIVYLVCPTRSFSKILQLIEKCSGFKNSKKLRYIIQDAETLSPFSHAGHLRKALMLNVLSAGQWGTYMLRDICFEKVPQGLQSLPVSKLSQLKMSGMDLKALGLTPTTGDLQDLERIIEYSGVREDGKEISGLGYTWEDMRTLEPDPILRWNKPDNWSHQEISSALLPYTMAYYMLMYEWNKKIIPDSRVVVLVHRGWLPLSQAVINLAIKAEYNIFTTYASEEEKNFIKSVFPQIPAEKVVDLRVPNIHEILYTKLQSHGEKGFTHAVNPTSDLKLFQATYKLLVPMGLYFQTSFSLENDATFGMRFFVNSNAVIGLNPHVLRVLNNELKKQLRLMFETGLKNGSVKPIEITNVSQDLTNYDVIKLLRDQRNCFKRLIASPQSLELEKSHWFSCLPKDSALIVVKGNNKLWVHILEWLVNRNTKNIHILLGKDADRNFISYKVGNLLKANPELQIYVNTTLVPENISRRPKCLDDMKQLRVVFIVGQVEDGLLNLVCKSAVEARLVYFTSKPSEYFEQSAKNGVQVVSKDLNGYTETVLKVIDSIVKTQDNVIFSKGISHETKTLEVDNLWMSWRYHLPTSVAELKGLRRKERRGPGWSETRTLSARLACMRGVPPILILPSLKEGAYLSLYRQLYFPAFIADIPAGGILGSIHQQLYKEAEQFKTESVTLICSEWTAVIGINLSKVMEGNGKKVTLIIFDSFSNWQTDEALEEAEQEVLKDFIDSGSKNKEAVEESLELIKNKVKKARSLVPTAEKKITGKVVLIKTLGCDKDDVFSMLQNNSEKAVTVFESEEEDYLKMVNSKKTADLINSLTDSSNNDWSQNENFLSYEGLTPYLSFTLSDNFVF